MTKCEDARLAATRDRALDAALEILQEKGVFAVTHTAVSAKTGIARSTLYRHWPTVEALLDKVFLRAASSPDYLPRTDGPLRADLTWLLTNLSMALTKTTWGCVAPQVIAAAATDERARSVINQFMNDRFGNVKSILDAAVARGEICEDLDLQPIVETIIAVPYFRRFVAGLPLDQTWIETHVAQICQLTQSK